MIENEVAYAIQRTDDGWYLFLDDVDGTDYWVEHPSQAWMIYSPDIAEATREEFMDEGVICDVVQIHLTTKHN